MFKRCNAALTLSRHNPSGRRPFLCISALLVAHLAQLNFASRALNRAKIGAGAHADNFETASTQSRLPGNEMTGIPARLDGHTTLN
jgi:hypothetical protein